MAKTTPPTTTTKTEKKADQKQEKPLISENTKITITIDAKSASAAYSKALKRLAVRVKHPGFRQGKVPTKIAAEVLGESRVMEAALDALLPQAYQEAITTSKKQPITQPNIRPVSLEMGKDWVLEAEIAERPELSITGYEKIAKKALEAGKKDLEKQVADAREEHKKAEKEAAQKATEEKKEHKVAAFQEPTEEQKRDYLTNRVYQALVQELKPAIPELLVREEVRYDLDELQRQLEPLNLSIQQYMERRGITEQQLSSDLAARALGRLQITLLLQEIAQAAKLSIDAVAIDAAIEDTKNPEMIAQKKNLQYRNLVEQTLLRKAVAEHLLAQN